jgi:hypothetical protein
MRFPSVVAVLLVSFPLACGGESSPTAVPHDVPAIEVESTQVSAAVTDLTVPIDVRPANDVNAVPLNGNGILPVAILGSESFDVTALDATTLEFGPPLGPMVPPVHDLGVDCVLTDHLQDVDEDGFLDLISHYAVPELAFEPTDELGCLFGKTTGGETIGGCDMVDPKP